MGYYLRAFCTAAEMPALREVLAYAEAAGYPLAMPADFGAVDLEARDWAQAEFTCTADDSRFVAETDHDEGTSDCLLREEVAEFVERIEDLGWRRHKRVVLEHLRDTKCIVSAQLLTAESGHWDVEAANVFLDYFVQHCGGMMQADGEGFYREGRLLLRVEG